MISSPWTPSLHLSAQHGGFLLAASWHSTSLLSRRPFHLQATWRWPCTTSRISSHALRSHWMGEVGKYNATWFCYVGIHTVHSAPASIIADVIVVVLRAVFGYASYGSMLLRRSSRGGGRAVLGQSARLVRDWMRPRWNIFVAIFLDAAAARRVVVIATAVIRDCCLRSMVLRCPPRIVANPTAERQARGDMAAQPVSTTTTGGSIDNWRKSCV